MLGLRVNAVVAFATSPPLGRRTEPEALKVRSGRRGPVQMHALPRLCFMGVSPGPPTLHPLGSPDPCFLAIEN